MKEKILKAFSDLGFKLEEEEGVGYSFSYEGLNLLYVYNENDEEFLNIALPGIIEVEEDRMLYICALLERINSSLKYLKAYMFGDSIWLFYEREVMGDEEDLMKVISRMILRLEAGLSFARKAMVDIDEVMAGGTAGDADESPVDESPADENHAEESEAEEIVDNNDND